MDFAAMVVGFIIATILFRVFIFFKGKKDDDSREDFFGPADCYEYDGYYEEEDGE